MTSLDFWIQPLWLMWPTLILVFLTVAFLWSAREWKRNIREVPLLALGVPVPRSGGSSNPFPPVFASSAVWTIPGPVWGYTSAPDLGRYRP